jgi:hypothetical protein
MKTYARLEDNVVKELFTTDSAICSLFHPSLIWIDVTGKVMEVGWVRVEGGGFAAPPPPEPGPAIPTLADLVAELADLRATLAQLRRAA